MAWFSKRRTSEREVPALCARCGQRPGTVFVHFVSGSAGREQRMAAQPAWLCNACRDEVGRDARDN